MAFLSLLVWLQTLIGLLCVHLSLGVVDRVVAHVAEVSEYVVERLWTNIRLTPFSVFFLLLYNHSIAD